MEGRSETVSGRVLDWFTCVSVVSFDFGSAQALVGDDIGHIAPLSE